MHNKLKTTGLEWNTWVVDAGGVRVRVSHMEFEQVQVDPNMAISKAILVAGWTLVLCLVPMFLTPFSDHFGD